MVFVGKLGSLKGNDLPNATIVTGSGSQVGGARVTWVNVLVNGGCDVREGRHIQSTLFSKRACRGENGLGVGISICIGQSEC